MREAMKHAAHDLKIQGWQSALSFLSACDLIMINHVRDSRSCAPPPCLTSYTVFLPEVKKKKKKRCEQFLIHLGIEIAYSTSTLTRSAISACCSHVGRWKPRQCSWLSLLGPSFTDGLLPNEAVQQLAVSLLILISIYTHNPEMQLVQERNCYAGSLQHGATLPLQVCDFAPLKAASHLKVSREVLFSPLLLTREV